MHFCGMIEIEGSYSVEIRYAFYLGKKPFIYGFLFVTTETFAFVVSNGKKMLFFSCFRLI